MNRIFLCLTFLLTTFSSCSDDEQSQEIIQVKYGTSFGMCVGYCKNELTAKSSLITYQKEGWHDSEEKVICSETLDQEIWDEVNNFNQLSTFFELPGVLGCPDCADGGAEWVEIELANGEKHRVTFEYFKAPDVLKDYVIILRSQMNQADHCGEF